MTNDISMIKDEEESDFEGASASESDLDELGAEGTTIVRSNVSIDFAWELNRHGSLLLSLLFNRVTTSSTSSRRKRGLNRTPKVMIIVVTVVENL